MMRSRVCALIVLGLLVPCARARAQGVPLPSAGTTTPLTLEQALQYAVEHYPAVRAAVEQVNASTAGVSVVRAAYLPRLDSLWQSNVATVNNIFGQVLPQSVLPALSGPVLPSTSGQGVWSSATGALASWEPFDFGLRGVTVAGAEAAVTRARAGEALTRLDVQGAVGAAFLNVVAAQRAVTAVQADVDRRDVLGRAVRTLVDNQLRPGADASRADAEQAAARTRLIQAQQTLAIAQAMLARVVGDTSGAVATDAGTLLSRLPGADVPVAAATAHPLAQVRQAAIGVAQAQQDVLARTDFPRIYLQSSVFARGSGANPNGLLTSGLDGLGLDRVNWAAGVQIVFPNAFDFSSLRARKAAAAATTRAESALYDEAVLTITSQQQAAAAMLQAARAVTANTPLQLTAAQQSEAQARARYDAGLATLSEVADAQSLLAQAEVQDQLARVEVWRALLAEALARGSITEFVALLRP